MAYPSTFEACDKFVMNFDGRANDAAPGEKFSTWYGVTQYTLDYAIGQGIVLQKDHYTPDDFETIRRALFWNVIHCSSLPPGVNLMLYNEGVLAGAGHAIRLLQGIVGARVDGVVGPQTIQLANNFGDKVLLKSILLADEGYLTHLKNSPLYQGGWLRREDECYTLALKMAGIIS